MTVIRSTLLAALAASFPISGAVSAQDSKEQTFQPDGVVVVQPEFASAPTKLDVPMPPKGAFDQRPHKHGMPPIPVGPPSHDVPARPLPSPGVVNPNGATVQVYRNSAVTPGGSRSTVGEPSTVKLIGGSTILQTGNWYAARSTNNGSSWSYVNPYTKFPAVDGGFCCDQVCQNVERQGITIWLLQYVYSATTQRGSIRLAIGVGDTRTGDPNHSYVLNPQLFGWPLGTWFDYPDIAASRKYTYVSINVFNAADLYQGSLVFRTDSASLKAGGNISIAYVKSISTTTTSRKFFAARLTRNYYEYPDTMHFAAQVNTTTLRIFNWPDAGSVGARDRKVGTWYAGRSAYPGPDGRDFLGRTDNRITAGFDTGLTATDGEIGFGWASNKGGSYPAHMFIRWASFDKSYNLTGEVSTYYADLASAYPSASVSSAGHVAGTYMVGGPTRHASTLAYIRDDLQCLFGWDSAWVVIGNSGPGSNKSGDYLCSQYINGNKWIVTGQAQIGGPANSQNRPHNAEIGRASLSFPTVRSLTINSSPAQGAAFSVDTRDYRCLGNGTTAASRTFRNGTVVKVTAATTLGSRSFHRWYIGSTAQPIGSRTLTLTMTVNQAIRAQYGNYSPPSYTSAGTSCLDANNRRSLQTGVGAPEIGKLATYRVTSAPPTVPVILMLGWSNTLFGGAIPLPFKLPGSSCYLYNDAPVALSTATNTSGTANVGIPLPNDPRLLGLKHYTQYWVIEVIPVVRLLTTNSITTTVGGWNLN